MASVATSAAAPLQILVPQLLCFALNKTLDNSTSTLDPQVFKLPDFAKIEKDMKKRNRQLGRKVENLQEQLDTATQHNMELQGQIYELHGNLTRVTQELQEVRFQKLHDLGNSSATIVEQMASLYEDTDRCKEAFNATTITLRDKEQMLKITEKKLDSVKEKLADTLDVLNSTEMSLNNYSMKFLYTDQIVNVLVADRALLLNEALALGNSSLSTPLIRLGTDVSIKDKYGFKPLDWAILGGDSENTLELIQAGSDVHSRHGDADDTPLHVAARHGFPDVAKALLDHGADPNSRNKIQNTPLHEASYYGQVEVVKVLVDNGAEIDPRNNYDVTPLLLAAEKGHKTVVQILVQKGAKRDVRNKAGRTPQEEAQHRGKQDVAWWLGQLNAINV